MLVDTSAWVEFDRGTGSATHLAIRDAIEADADIFVTEPVMMELLAGAKDPVRRRLLHRLLLRFELLRFDSTTDFLGASRVYQRCREAGHTPRDFVDCMIAAVALRHDVPLLGRDADFERIALATDLRLQSVGV
jgi:predicted nucleic acid-binding protein